MNYVGIDWADGRAAFCAMGETGAIASEGLIRADEDGLARLVLDLGPEAKACVEMMSGAIWVCDRLELAAGRSRSPTPERSATSPPLPARPTRSTPECSPSSAAAIWSRHSGSPRSPTEPFASRPRARTDREEGPSRQAPGDDPGGRSAVEAAHQAWRESNPWHGHYRQIAARHGKNPAKSAVARKLLIASWHMLSRQEPFRPSRPRRGDQATAPASSSCFLGA